MFTHPHPVLSASPSDPQKIHYAVARINDYPALLLKSLRVVRSLCQFYLFTILLTFVVVLDSVCCIRAFAME